MSADYTTTGLIANAKRRGAIPVGSGLTTSELLQVLSEQLRTYIPAFLKNIREEYIIATLSIAVTSGTVAAPRRAVGAAFRSLQWTLSDGTLKPLVRIEPERRSNYALTGEPVGYVFQGNNILLVPAPTSGTVVLGYQQRPGQLVLSTSCAVFTTASSTTARNCTAIPASIVAGAVVDLVSTTPNFKLLAMDMVISSVVSGLVTFTTALPSDLAAGDYLALAHETPIPQMPFELFDLLAQATAFQVASDTGSTRLPAIEKALKRLEEQMTTLLSPRSDGSARPIISKSRLGYRGL